MPTLFDEMPEAQEMRVWAAHQAVRDLEQRGLAAVPQAQEVLDKCPAGPWKDALIKTLSRHRRPDIF